MIALHKVDIIKISKL